MAFLSTISIVILMMKIDISFFKVLLHLSCEGMQVVSPQLIPDRDHQKFMTVDIRVKLKDGTLVSIEMQQFAFSMFHYKRFATYNTKMLAKQMEKESEITERMNRIVNDFSQNKEKLLFLFNSNLYHASERHDTKENGKLVATKNNVLQIFHSFIQTKILPF